MLGRIWQWLVRVFQQLTGIFKTNPLPTLAPTREAQRAEIPPLSDAECESYFLQLLEEVNRGWDDVRVLRFFEGVQHRANAARWAAWLRGFGEKVLNSPVANRELGRRLVLLGSLARSLPPLQEIGEIAGKIGADLLVREAAAGSESTTPPPLSPSALSTQHSALSTQDIDAWFETGVERLEAGENEAALTAFARVLELDPNHHRALVNRGNALANLGQIEEAIASYDRAISIIPDFRAAWSNKGDVLFDAERYEEALACYEKVLEWQPENSEIWYTKGMALGRGLGRWEEAIASFDKAIEYDPDDAEMWFNRGIAFGVLKRWEDAIACWDRAIELQPDYRDAWANKGVAYQHLGRIQEAIEANEKAIALYSENGVEEGNPKGSESAEEEEGVDTSENGVDEAVSFQEEEGENNREGAESAEKEEGVNPEAEFFLNQGIEQGNAGDFHTALASFNRAIEIQPNYHLAWNNKGSALNDLRRHEESLNCYNRAIEIQPNYHVAWNGKGVTLNDLGRYEEAIDCYNHALDIQPNFDYGWNNKGNALYGLSRYEEAIDCYNRALDIQPNYDNAWNGKGVALNNLGRYEEAIDCYNRAIDIQPNFYHAWNGKGNALGDLERYEEAIDCYNRAIDIQPNFDYACYGKGNALYGLRRYEEAIDCYNRAIEIQSNYYAAWNGKGNALSNLGRYEEAIDCYNRAIEIQPNLHFAWNNKGSALDGLGRHEEAIECYNRAIEIQANYDSAWNNKGSALNSLGQHEEAIECYNRAIEIQPNYDNAWHGKGVALSDLRRSEEAIDCYNRVLLLTGNQHWRAWANRGWAVFRFRGYEAAIQNWDEGLQAIQSAGDKEGCGLLHQQKGYAHYQHGQLQRNRSSYWIKAKNSYLEALQLFSEPRLRVQYLEVLQSLAKVCRALDEPGEVETATNTGIVMLEQLLLDTASDAMKIRLSEKFAGFYDLRVEQLASSPDAAQHVEALELAEKRKNFTLSCYHYSRWEEAAANSPTFAQMQALLDAEAAAIYWHVSPAAITAFVLKHAQPPVPILAAGEGESPAAARQLQAFQEWLTQWRQGEKTRGEDGLLDVNFAADSGNEEGAGAGRGRWQERMPDELQRLAEILEIQRILPLIAGARRLILVPHRDLHLLPLEVLFPEDCTISRLPSFQIGLERQHLNLALFSPPGTTGEGASLLLVEKTDARLVYADIESAVIAQLFPHTTRLAAADAAPEALQQALSTGAGVFHFTGHGCHNPNQPLESSLQLTGKAGLTAREIFPLDLSRWQLVCLSACKTGVTGKDELIDEFVGIVSAFLAAGVTGAVSTLWAVRDSSTAWLMLRFYQFLEEGVAPALALKRAQQWLRTLTYRELWQWQLALAGRLANSAPDYSQDLEERVSSSQEIFNTIETNNCPFAHPYYWAGFTFTGKVNP